MVYIYMHFNRQIVFCNQFFAITLRDTLHTLTATFYIQ